MCLFWLNAGFWLGWLLCSGCVWGLLLCLCIWFCLGCWLLVGLWFIGCTCLVCGLLGGGFGFWCLVCELVVLLCVVGLVGYWNLVGFYYRMVVRYGCGLSLSFVICRLVEVWELVAGCGIWCGGFDLAVLLAGLLLSVLWVCSVLLLIVLVFMVLYL